MKKNVTDAIGAAFDEVMSEYESNHHVIFETESIRKKLHYGDRDARLTAWKRTRRCIYRGCQRQSLRRSHTISKSASLQHIAQGSEVLTPEFDHHTGRIEMKRRGLAWASTFPGFCAEHESLFFDFEQRKGLETDQHIVLQIYRTVCREIIRKRIEVETGQKYITSYEKMRDSRLIALMERKLGPKLIKDEKISFKGLNLEGRDPIIKPAYDHLANARIDLKTLEEEHLGLLEQAIQDPSTADISPVLVRIDTLIPVALAGLAVFHVLDHGARHRVLVILNILPADRETVLLMYGRRRDQRYVEGYLANWPDTNSILNMIESWMIHGTDHWFIRPSIWACIPPSRRRAILDSILDISKNIGDYPEYSIFDEIRSSQISSAEALLLERPDDPLAKKIVARERKKIFDEPQ